MLSTNTGGSFSCFFHFYYLCSFAWLHSWLTLETLAFISDEFNLDLIWLLSRAQLTEKPVIYSVVENSVETLQAQKRMLREEIDDLEKLKTSGELSAENYLESKRFARERLADVEARLQKAQPDYKPQVVYCPSCGGPVEISMDRCEYCGHVLL